MATVLETKDLRSGYATGDVLQGVSIGIGGGEVVGVLGRNGVGKSTLMRTLIGLLPVRGGSVLFNGRDIGRDGADRRARRGIGYVPQGRDIFPNMSVLDNLRMGRFVNDGKVAPESCEGHDDVATTLAKHVPSRGRKPPRKSIEKK